MERGRLKEKEYWLSKLAGEWERTCVPHGYPAAGKKRENKAGRELETVHLGFTGELCGRLLKLSKDSNPMLHMILTAGLAVLLTGYTDSSDIIVGTPIYRQESEGKFINTVLVLRNRVSPGMTFKELLLEVRQDILESVAHQNFPLETLSVELGLPVSVGQCPLFDITLLLDNIHDKRYIEHLSTSINFSFNRSGQRIGGVMEYDGLIYDKPVMEQMARHFIRLLGQGVLHVDTALSQLEFLSDEERKKLLVDFNDTQADYPREKTLDRLFAEQAERTPEKIAIVGSWQLAVGKGERTGEVAQLTYRELNEKSSQLARVLREKGVEADTIVGLMVYPGVDMLIGLMAVLKAGGAYLPMDPYFPPSRICSWLKDSSTGILLTHGPLMAAMKMEWDREVILLEDETLYRGDGPGPAPPAESARLAYVIYTSGSTGIPRGVLIEHRSILNYVSWRIAAYGHTAGDISLQLISFSFDGFGANLYPCLLTGGTLLLPDQDQLKSTGYIRGLIRDMKVTNFSIVPSLYRVILEGGEPGDFRSLRFVVLAGEKTSEDLICMSNELIPGLRLINEYGPTENSVTTAAHPGMNPENPAVIGRPIANNRVFIRDGNQNPRPQGIPGELCVSGEGLARGYLNSPELTAEKFDQVKQVKGPDEIKQKLLRGVQGGSFLEKSPPGRRRQYKTGDLARWLPDGTLEILGRLDHQVQVRGFRIEPGEIETCLRAHKDIKEAVVMEKEKSLCAYIVSGRKMAVPEIREYLSRGLPDYMVPAYFVQLEQMPLTPTGKIDRGALRQLEIRRRIESEYIAPRNSIEEKLAQIWGRFLGIESPGIRDNFFNIGGDSIKSISLLSHINKELNTGLELVDLYENETIEKLASKINRHEESAGGSTGEYTRVVGELEALKSRILKGNKEQ